MSPDRNTQRGFSLIMAIFLVVVLGGIAVFMGRVATMQYHGSVADEEGALAYQTARAGVEWGVYQALQVPAYACTTGTSSTDTFSPGGALAPYTVTVACTRSGAVEGTTGVDLYQITSTAKNGSGATSDYYVERQLQVTVSK
jgi:MSHA biogenesis protein MshP